MSKLDGKAPTILTAEGARRVTARIRDALVAADDLLVQAYEGRAWEALGYADWRAYCEGELPELRHLKLRVTERRARVQALRDADATIPEIVAATGSSLGTVHRDLVALEGGHRRTVVTVNPRAVSSVDRAVALVAAAGADGLTVRELCAATGWHHGMSSAALSKAHKRGRITPSGVRRDGCGAYIV